MFGLDTALVARTLAHLSDIPAHSIETPVVRRVKEEAPVRNRLTTLLGGLLDRSYANFWVTMVFLAGLFIAFGTGRLVLALISIETLQPIRYVLAFFQLIVLLVSPLIVFKRAQLRCAIGGAAILALATGINSGWDRNPTLTYSVAVVATTFALTFFFYAAISIPASIFGGYARMRGEHLRLQNMTRQDSIGRLLDLREAVKTMTSESPGEVTLIESWTKWVHPRAIVLGVAGAIVAHILTTALGLIFDPHGKLMSGDPSNVTSLLWLVLAMLVISVLYLVYLLGLGLFSGSVGRATGVGLAATTTSLAMMFIPVGQYNMANLDANTRGSSLGFLLAYFATPVAGAIAAMIEGQSRRQKRVKENDPSALIAEMIHLEWRLRPRSQSVCVLVVDASKSSEMKAMADPFEAEWSFREYQKFLERVAVKNGGLVHSTAGDGAVIGFSTCQDALQAAHDTYAELAEFNQTVNRLQTPFRLRIGIHVGEIQGALDQVEFTEVIDIAAHIEGAAPIGGIAMSKAVLNELPGVLAMPINRVVDGYEVYTVGGPSFAL
jgi:class 3 adenylate cyclase